MAQLQHVPKLHKQHHQTNTMPSQKTLTLRTEIKELIETIGIWNIPKKHLAEKHHISRPTLDRHLRQIIKAWPKDDIEETKLALQNGYKKAIKEAEKILANPASTPREKMDGGRTISMLNKEYVNMLENFGLKERIANKTELTVQGKGKLTIEQIQEAFANKNEKEKE